MIYDPNRTCDECGMESPRTNICCCCENLAKQAKRHDASTDQLHAEVERLRALVSRACSMLDDAVQLRNDANEWFPAIAAIRAEAAK